MNYRVWLSMFAVVLGPLVARGDFVIRQKIENSKMNGTMTTRVQDNQARVDTSLSAGMHMTMLMNFRTGELITLMPKQKEAMKFSRAQFKAAADALKASLGSHPKPPPPQDSGKSAMVNGYQTEIYNWTNINGVLMRFWVAGNFPNYKAFTTQLEKVNGFTAPDITKGRIRLDPASLPGMVMKETDTHGTNVNTVTLVSAKEEKVDASVFAIPSSYHVTDVQKEEAKEKQLQSALQPGNKLPAFRVKAVDGKPLSLADYKGKVVLIDFWATWCPPCRAEVPNVVAAYKKNHRQGFDIIGVSLDQNRQKLLAFTKEHDMTWPQYFDGQGWQNKLAVKYGIRAIPATFLLDTNGVIIAKDLRGAALEQAVAQALPKK